MKFFDILEKVIFFGVIVFCCLIQTIYPVVFLFSILYIKQMFNSWLIERSKSHIDVEFKNGIREELNRLNDITSKLSMTNFGMRK